MIINNTSKSVKVLKAVGLPALRLFPGHNECKDDDARAYLSNDAAKGMVKECLFIVDGGNLDLEEKEQIEKARKKNAELNKAKRIVQKQETIIKKNESVMSDQEKIIKEQAEKLDSQAKELDAVKIESEEQGAQILELMESVKALQEKPKEEPDEKPKGKGKAKK